MGAIKNTNIFFRIFNKTEKQLNDYFIIEVSVCIDKLFCVHILELHLEGGGISNLSFTKVIRRLVG